MPAKKEIKKNNSVTRFVAEQLRQLRKLKKQKKLIAVVPYDRDLSKKLEMAEVRRAL